MTIAQVVVDIPARAVDRVFDYEVPEGLVPDVLVGVPVLVDFGHRKAVGYVVGLVATSDQPSMRPLEAVLGVSLFDEGSVRVARWIARTYVSTLADALRLFLPPGGVPKVVAETDASGGRVWRLARPQVRAIDDRVVEPIPDAPAGAVRVGASLQRAVLDAVSEGPVTMAELSADLGRVQQAVARLESLGLVKVTSRRRWRTPGGARRADTTVQLSTAQIEALCVIGGALDDGGGTVLLHGVTGSGKTEVYMRAIESVLDQGRGALVLVPEISLTPQTVGRFRARFGEQVAVLHSRLSPGERYDQWSLVADGTSRLVVGARSALFAPIRELALVVVDEEHESSYKQGSSPRYHARDAARRLCEERGAVLLLGSATPSLESLTAAADGRYRLAVLPERVGGGTPPEIVVVDMAEEFASGRRSMFSRELTGALEKVREEQGKAVLLMNRRGFATFVLCRECGHVPNCPDCSVSMTYHDSGHRLICHHCGRSEPMPPDCPECHSPYLRQFGAGTQRVETELAAAVPGLPIVRMDADTTSGKGGHERRLAEFEALTSGVLLGTQMVAKGLDYPEVTLVGVVNADTTMHLPDMRAAERTYQLLEQVAGRAGRGHRAGLVVIQTYWPEHPAVRALVARDPELLYGPERAERLALGYPPYGRLARVLVTGEDLSAVTEGALAVAAALRAAARPGWHVLGPAPAPLARLKRLYRRHALVKSPVDEPIEDAVAAGLQVAVPDGVTVIPDVDPVDMM
jgi:primosomal protein N' (replication factor Y) (superfamily II helicase)